MRYLSLALLAMLVGCSSTATTNQATTEATGAAETASTETESVSTETEEGSQTASGEASPIIIDVRSKAEWDGGHLEQAVNIPHTSIADRIGELTSDKDAQIILYCAAGGRAGTAKAKLEELGFTNVENAGGYEDVKQRFK
ncbi:MAG: hypothetical protein KDB22_18790 [Planctomycetales bacterium]|nr:hypothetical protein [Planctomycetales bacterium]